MKLLIVLSIVIFTLQAKAQTLNDSEWYLKTSDSLDLYVKEVGTGVTLPKNRTG